MNDGRPTRDKPIVYAPVGRCIYCGTSDPKTRLGREHIMPLGLDGGFVLPRASCSACATVTGRIEQKVLTGFFGPYRRHIKLSSKRRKERTGLYRLNMRLADGSIVQKMVSINDYPKFLVMPRFVEPSILTGAPLLPITAVFRTHYNAKENKKIESELGGEPLMEVSFDLITFARMLAKIAHSFATGELGSENFKPFLPRFILGQDLHRAGYFIGQSGYVGTDQLSKTMHHMTLRFRPYEAGVAVLVGIHLFSSAQPITYAVAAGDFTPKRSILKWKGLTKLSPPELQRFLAPFGLTPDPGSFGQEM